MSVPFASQPGISGIFGRIESAPGYKQSVSLQLSVGKPKPTVTLLPVSIHTDNSEDQEEGGIFKEMPVSCPVLFQRLLKLRLIWNSS